MNRRTYLRSSGAVAIALAGCVGSEKRSDGRPTAEKTEQRTTASATIERSHTAEATPTGTIHAGYETTSVDVVTPDGELLGSVTAAIADTAELRYRGLSDTERLPPDRGMLFVYERAADRVFVMRRMSFGIDIVYADTDGTITRIHHAPEPDPDEDGDDQRYPGRGQYVLEVDYHWTTRHGVNVSDSLVFDLDE